VYGTGIASETLLTSATEPPVCPDTQASFICLYVFAMVGNERGRELDAVAWRCDPAETRWRCWPFGVARARFNVTPCVRRLSTFITHAIFSFSTKTNMPQQNIWCRSTWKCLAYTCSNQSCHSPFPSMSPCPLSSTVLNYDA
jgi:hypothetical protein